MTKPDNLKYIWVIRDEYGDICTEFFYPEDSPGQVPYNIEKDMMYMDPRHKCAAIRLKVEVVETLPRATANPTYGE